MEFLDIHNPGTNRLDYQLGILSSCAIVTSTLRRVVFLIFNYKNAVTLKTGLLVRRGHWKSHHAIYRI